VHKEVNPETTDYNEAGDMNRDVDSRHQLHVYQKERSVIFKDKQVSGGASIY